MVSVVSVCLCLAMLGVRGEVQQCEGEECLHGEGEQEAGECAGRVGFFPNLSQCDAYYECRDSKVSSHLCPDGLVYDSSHFKADFQVTLFVSSVNLT